MTADPLQDRTTPRAGAAYWLNERRSGDMTPADVKAFEAWLEADPDNRAAYERLERLWAAAVLVADEPQLLAAREAASRRHSPGLRLRWVGAIAASLVVAAGAWGLVNAPGALPFAKGSTEFQTSVGQRTTVKLPDGSVVTLDTDTILKVHDRPDERLVSLKRGRAFFRVAKDPSRPFVVAAGGHRVRALGTAFDVRVGREVFEVTLIEGRVKVETPSPLRRTAASANLEPGQRLAIQDETPQLIRVDLRSETTWHEGRLTFARDPLADAVVEMNRYSDKKIVFRGGKTPDRSIVGVFRAGDVDSFAKALVMNGVAVVAADTDSRIELSAVEKIKSGDPSLGENGASF